MGYKAYNGAPIAFQPHVKDLGVWMSTSFIVNEHRIITKTSTNFYNNIGFE